MGVRQVERKTVTRVLRFLVILAEIVILLALVAVMALIIDHRLSRQLDAVEITWEEVRK